MVHLNPLKSKSDLLSSLRQTKTRLSQINTESDLSLDEIKASVEVWEELKRILTLSTRTGDWTFRANQLEYEAPSQGAFKGVFDQMMNDFDTAAKNMTKSWRDHPAAVRPLGRETLSEVRDFFVLDNSLRETTVGVPRGHTLEEKHQIVDEIAKSGMKEVILGAFGSKISVDSQIASRWTTELGRKLDHTWGFSSIYDFELHEEEPVVKSYMNFVHRLHTRKAYPAKEEFMVPPRVPKLTYSKDDLQLFKKAFRDFRPDAFGGRKPEQVLKDCEFESGRIPMGLLMIAGYGICNAIIEVDIVYENFDHEKYDNTERLLHLLKWCKENMPKHQDGDQENVDPRILVNFTDFPMWKNSIGGGGLEKAMYTIYTLSSLPPDQRPFGYGMEDPTCWLMPDEVGKYTRMIRLMMNHCGHEDGKFLVHVHMYFGLAEASVLSCVANGADGVWAAMCCVGAQVGHASSTLTTLNLVRLGNTHLAEQYNLQKMCAAAREIHTISTHEPCPINQECYGIDAFDYPFSMLAIPYCRHALIALITNMGINERPVRINELSSIGEVEMAMMQTFGHPRQAGWDPKYCTKMWEAIHNHMLTGLSRDYNTPAGMGHLYGLVSKKKLPAGMVKVMLKHSKIPDHHPTVIDFIGRWNRLCARYEGEELPLPGSLAPSCFNYSQDITVEPRRTTLPFTTYMKDVVIDNFLMKPIPKVFKRYVIKLITKQEMEYQGTKKPVVEFYDQIIQLKLFIQEAESLGVLPLVDDFSIRKNHAFMFGEDHNWLRDVRGTRPKKVNQMLRLHIDFYPRFYANYGNNNIVRCCRAAAKRVNDNMAITEDLLWLREGEDKQAVEEVALDESGDMDVAKTFDKSKRGLRNFLRSTRESVTLRPIAEDKGPERMEIQIIDDDESSQGEDEISRQFYNRVHNIMDNEEDDDKFGDDLSEFLDPTVEAAKGRDEKKTQVSANSKSIQRKKKRRRFWSWARKRKYAS